MKPTSTWSYCIFIEFDLCPTFTSEVKYPEIIHICQTFSSEYYQIRVAELGNMVSSLPRSSFVFFRCNLSPNFCVPIKNADWVETLLVWSSSSKNYNLVGGRIVVDGTVRSVSWFLSCSVDFFPDSLSGMIGPEVIHVIRIYMCKEIPAYPPKKRT